MNTQCTGKREQNKQANRAALLDAARRCFLDMGYEAVTVRDIVRLTDLASGTFYNYFPDKECMFREILETHINELNARLHKVRQQAQSRPSSATPTAPSSRWWWTCRTSSI